MPYKVIINEKEESTNLEGTFHCIFCAINSKKKYNLDYYLVFFAWIRIVNK